MRTRIIHENLESRLLLAALPFAESSSSLLASADNNSVVVANFDGDQEMEVVSVGTGRIFEWNSAVRGFHRVGAELRPILFERGNLPPVRQSIRSARAFDGDADGDQDLFVVSRLFHNSMTFNISVYENRGDGNFGVPQLVSSFESSDGGGRLADVDGDRDLDVFRIDNWSENVNNELTPFRAYPIAHRIFDFADADQDGDEDGFFHNGDTNTIESVDIKSGQRHPFLSTDLRVGGKEIDDIRTLRVDVGSQAEISIVGALDDSVWFVNASSDRWQPSVLNIPEQRDTYGIEFNGFDFVELSDFDGDQDLDIVTLLSIDDGADSLKWFEGLATEYDLDADGTLSAADIDRFCQGVREGDSAFDINADDAVNALDAIRFARSLGSPTGDITLDGVFDSLDLVTLFQQDTYDKPAEWSTGDWNCDGRFDSADLILAFQEGTYRSF